MKSHTQSPWYAAPPSAPQASRIIAWVSVVSASVYGAIVIGSLFAGATFHSWGMVFTFAATHLVVQAGTSAFSWKTGARFAKISLGFFALASLPIGFGYDVKILSVFTPSAIISLAAVKIALDRALQPNGG